jgi:hypothetical protein
MATDFDIETFTELYEGWLHTDDEDRPGSAAEDQLRHQYRQAWQVGGRHPRLDILHFIMGTRLAEGADLVWEALNDDEDELMVAAALGAALMLLRPHPELAEPTIVERLKALVETGPDRVRFLALTVLDRPRLDSLDPLLRELAEHSDDDSVRHYAYRMLLRSGYDPAKRAIFADIRQRPDRFAPAIDLYSYRAVLDLSDAEVHELREMLRRYVEKTRQLILDGDSAPPVSVVGALARDGLAINDPAAEAIAQYARTAERARERREAVEALAAIGTPRASELLGELAFAEPADVAERAREVLGEGGDAGERGH